MHDYQNVKSNDKLLENIKNTKRFVNLNLRKFLLFWPRKSL